MEAGCKLRFGFGKVKGAAIGLGRTCNEENDKCNDSRNMSFENEPAISLHFDDL